MPQLTFPVTSDGLVVPVWIGLGGKEVTDLVNAKKPVPPPVSTYGLVDTGSNVTSIASWIVQQLGLLPATTGSTSTVGGQVPTKIYEVSLSITDPSKPKGLMLTYSDLVVMELPVDIEPDVLVGRDVILNHDLYLDSKSREFTITF